MNLQSLVVLNLAENQLQELVQKKQNVWRIDGENLGCPPSLDSSHHQDYETFLGSGIPN